MIKVAVLDDYQDAFRQIIEIEKYKNKYDFKIFNEPFVNENEAIFIADLCTTKNAIQNKKVF